MTRIVFLALLILAAPAAAEMQVEVIPLQHRTVEDIVPVLQPLLAPGGTLTGMNNQLVVKTTPENLAEIRELLSAIDRRLRRLLITVTQDVSETRSGRDSGISGRYDSGNVEIETGGRGPRHGTSVTAGDGDDFIRYGVRDRGGAGTDRGGYTVQTVEGQAAFIESGSSLPLPQRNVVVTPHGEAVIQDTIEYHDAASGFYVLPRLSGNTVNLIISPYMTRVQGGRLPVFDVQSAETTVSGRLGDWIQIGGIDIQSQHSGRENLNSHTIRSSETRSLYVRVEELP